MPRDIQPSFVGGEITPSLHSRVDLEKYHHAVATLKNWFVHAQGGISTRPGTEFVGQCRGVSRLIPFQFNTEQAYALVFSKNYMRVIRNGGYVVEAGKTITNITATTPAVITIATHGYAGGSINDTVYITGTGVTAIDNKFHQISNVTTNTFEIAASGAGWTSGGTSERLFELGVPWFEDDLFQIKYTQSADVMTVTHPDFGAREITRTGHDAWTLTSISFSSGVSPPANAWVNQIGTPAAGSDKRNYKYIVTAVDGTGRESQPSAEISTGFLATSTQVNITGITSANPPVVSCAGHTFLVDDTVYITGVSGMTQVNGRYFRVQAVVAGVSISLDDSFGTTYGTYTSGGTVTRYSGDIDFLTQTYGNQISWSQVTGAEYYNIYKENSTNSGVFGWIGETKSTERIFTDFNFLPDLSITPPISVNPFGGPGNNPRCAGYFQQRIFYASTNNNPQTVWGSKSAQFNNMDYSRPLRDDDAMQFSVRSRQVNEIRHLIGMDELLAFTSGSIFKLGADEDGVITPSNINPVRTGGYGCSNVPPVVIGESVLYIQEKGGRVRDMPFGPNMAPDPGRDLSVMADHLFVGKTVVDWCYCEEPFGLVWVVLNDGMLLSLTYLREHQVWAWAKHETDGSVESVCSVPEGEEDILYMVVKRTINGSDVRYVERMKERLLTSTSDWFYVDSGLTFTGNTTSIIGATQANPVVVTAPSHGLSNGDAVNITGVLGMTELNLDLYRVANVTADTFELQDLDSNNIDGQGYGAYTSGGTVQFAAETITGLDHLEGKTVVALGDGDVFDSTMTVSGGSVSLPTPAGVVHVGLQYSCDVETLNIDFPGGPTVQSRKKSVGSLAVRVRDTRGLKAGASADKLYETKERDVSMAYGQLPSVTGQQIWELERKWTDGGKILIRQDNPLPATILALIPEINVSA